MPFQDNASLGTGFWRYQQTDSNGSITEDYVNLAIVARMKTNRTGQQKVWFWYETSRVDSRDADLTFSGPVAAAFLTDLDGLFS